MRPAQNVELPRQEPNTGREEGDEMILIDFVVEPKNKTAFMDRSVWILKASVNKGPLTPLKGYVGELSKKQIEDDQVLIRRTVELALTHNGPTLYTRFKRLWQ
jgi:hypothetical protein